MSLNLHALAATVVRESPDPDPDAMVAAFVAQIDPADYAEAVRYLARDLLRAVIRGQREALNGGATRTTGSRKVEAARDAWQKLLNAPEFVPSVGWVFLRDATRDQVMEMSAVRMEKSRELVAAAKQYKRLADAMDASNVKTVAELDERTLAALLSPAAKAVKAA